MRRYYLLLFFLSFLVTLFAVPTIIYILLPFREGLLSYLSMMISYPISLFIIDRVIKKSGKRGGLREVVGPLDKRLLTIVFVPSIFIVLAFTLLDGSSISRSNEPLSLILLSLLISVIFIPMQCFSEELIFRILFQKATLKDGFNSSLINEVISLILSSALFSVLHLANSEANLFGSILFSFFYYFSSGAFIYLLTYIERGYTAAIAYHTANNLFIAVVINRESTSSTLPSFSFFVTSGNFIPLYAILSVVIAILAVAMIILIYKKAMYRREQIGKEETKQEEKENSY